MIDPEYERQDLELCGIPRRYLDVLYGDMKETEAIRVAKTHARDVARGACLVLSGPVGVGKTIAAVRLFRWLYRRRICGFFIPSPEINYENAGGLAEARVLLIDDLGTERFPQDIEYLLEVRHAKVLSTIITTNLNLDAVRRTYGERLVDRFREWAIFYELKGTSLRRKHENQEGTGKPGS